MKCHLQKVWYKDIHPALRYRALLSLAKSGTEPPAGVEPQPGTELPAGSQRQEGSFTKGLTSKYSSSFEIFIHVTLYHKTLHLTKKRRFEPREI